MDDARRKRLAVVLVDVTDLEHPRVAAVNGDEMMYAASLPKIAVLLGAFEKIAEGKMKLDCDTEWQLHKMIKASSNTAATEMMHRVGKEYIARVLLSPRYRLYDPKHNGGLWVGKDYAKAGLWRRDPLHNLSHGATAMQVARFYYLLETENLVTPEHSRKMKEILGNSLLHTQVRQGDESDQSRRAALPQVRLVADLPLRQRPRRSTTAGSTSPSSSATTRTARLARPDHHGPRRHHLQLHFLAASPIVGHGAASRSTGSPAAFAQAGVELSR